MTFDCRCAVKHSHSLFIEMFSQSPLGCFMSSLIHFGLTLFFFFFIVIIDQLGLAIVPFTSLLILPVLGRMSDHNNCVRLMATNCFASLVRLMPLDVRVLVVLSNLDYLDNCGLFCIAVSLSIPNCRVSVMWAILIAYIPWQSVLLVEGHACTL